MGEILRCNTIIGTHPLFGPQSAPDSILGQRVAVCPVKGDHDKIVGFLSGLGLKVIQCTPEEHDRQMAVSQALCHFIGRAVVEAGISKVDLSTKTFDDLMNIVRVISGNSMELFQDMQQLNPFANEIRQKFIDACEKVDEDLS